MTEVVITNDAPSGCSDVADVPTCAVLMCVNSVPPLERPCKLHQCNYGQPSCDCTPPALASFVAFPSELEDRARWIRLIGREDLVSGEAEGKRCICSLHFPDAEPTEANPDPLLNLNPTPKLDLQNDDLEVSVPAFIIVEDKHDNKLGSQDETEDSPKSNDGGTSLAVTTQSSPTLDPQSIDEMNLKKSDSQDDDLKANTSMPVTMEDSYENQPALEVEVETSSKGDDAETSLVVTSRTTYEPIPQSKNEMTSKKVNLKTSRSSPAKVKKSKTVVAPRKPVVRESRQRRAASRKDYSEFSKESSTSSESESSDSEGDTGSDSDSDSDGRVYCKCGQPNTDDMIGCDGKHCEHEWFHFKCVGINPKKVPRGKWFCETCQVKQEDSAWSSKLKQVCREIMAKSITLQSASQAYGISVATLSKRLNSNPILTTQEENRLVEMAVNMCKQGHWPMVKESVLNSVKVLLDVEEKMGIKRLHPFTKNLPPDDWWHAFCRRHPKIRQLKRQHQASQSAQASQVENSSDVKKSKREGVNGETPSSANTISKSHKKGSSETKQLSNQAQKLGLKCKKLSLEKSHQNQSLDTSDKKDHTATSEGSLNGKDPRPNAFQCLEAIIVKKQRHAFQRQFKSGDESENDPLYSAWRALRCLYGDPVEKEQADSSRKHIPDTDGDIPPWAPCKRGPFYVPDESTKTSVSLLLGEPSKKRRKGALSRITSMKAKIQSHYLEPWRFRLSNRKALKPWKFEVKKRNRRKSFVTRRLAGNY